MPGTEAVPQLLGLKSETIPNKLGRVSQSIYALIMATFLFV